MDALLKKRLLNEQRYFLNKTNSKWISVGVKPGYRDLNNTEFRTEITIAGESGGVSLTVNGLKSVINLFKGITYFSRFGPPNNIELERGVLMSEFQMGGTPCYKILNQATNTSVCIGLTSVEELLEMEQLLFSIINEIDTKALETEFLMILDRMSKNWNDFYKKSLKKTSKLAGQLLLNFYDFVMVCVELKKQAVNIDNIHTEEQSDIDDQTPQQSPLPSADENDESTEALQQVVSDGDDGDYQPVVKKTKYCRKYMIQKKTTQK